MKTSPNNHEAKLALYYSDKRVVQPLEVWLGCVGEEFLIQHFPDKNANWRAHQLEYMVWGPYTSKGAVDFRWQHGNRPLWPAEPTTDLTTDDLLRLYEATRSLWIALHVGAITIAAQRLQQQQEVPADLVVLPDPLRWMVVFLAGQIGQAPERLFGFRVKFHSHGPYEVVTEEQYGSKTNEIEFPRFTNMTLALMPDVLIGKDNP